jgi:hypothetical protein
MVCCVPVYCDFSGVLMMKRERIHSPMCVSSLYNGASVCMHLFVCGLVIFIVCAWEETFQVGMHVLIQTVLGLKE